MLKMFVNAHVYLALYNYFFYEKFIFSPYITVLFKYGGLWKQEKGTDIG